MIATKHLSKCDLVFITLTHFFSIHCYHIIVHPVFCRRSMIANGTLCYLTFMVRKHQVHSATMNIKPCSQIFCSHGRTFYMPTRETFYPWAFPSHNAMEKPMGRRFPGLAYRMFCHGYKIFGSTV